MTDSCQTSSNAQPGEGAQPWEHLAAGSLSGALSASLTSRLTAGRPAGTCANLGRYRLTGAHRDLGCGVPRALHDRAARSPACTRRSGLCDVPEDQTPMSCVCNLPPVPRLTGRS